MRLTHPRYALPVSFLCLLAACGGGGGGGTTVTDVTFTSWSALGPNQRANMTGTSQTVSGNVSPAPGGGIMVNSVTPGPLDSSLNTRATVTFDGNRNVSAFSFMAPESSAGFGSGIDCSAGAVCVAETATSVGVLGNPRFPAHNWNYQTYGVWLVQPSPSTFQAGAISVGAPTPAVPTTGSANFTGFTSGFYVNEAAVPHVMSANVTANVNFAAPTLQITFNTNTTVIGNVNTGSITQDDGLNLSGMLSYSAGSNQFSGTVTTQNTFLTGNANGRFYGPNAQEMGGVFNLTGTLNRSMIGAFGARQ